MGVYYIIVNDSKKEYIDPFDFDDSVVLSGVFTGVHNIGIAELLVHPSTTKAYEIGYWSGDNIRVLGDNQKSESELVARTYKNISFYVLASVFESHSAFREEIIERAKKHEEILQGLTAANQERNLVNLNYSLSKLDEGNT